MTNAVRPVSFQNQFCKCLALNLAPAPEACVVTVCLPNPCIFCFYVPNSRKTSCSTANINVMVLNGICLQPVSIYSFLAIQQTGSVCGVHGIELDTV